VEACGTTGVHASHRSAQITPVERVGRRRPAEYPVPEDQLPSGNRVEHRACEDENVIVTTTSPDDWSPADNPYAIAVSEAQWWQRAVQLAVMRVRGKDDDSIAWHSSRQIDARQLVFALRQLLTAEQLEQAALKALGIDPVVGQELTKARKKFEDALPGVKDMRDALMHFDEWARGTGLGPQKERRQAGEALRDVARFFWGFAYDPSTDTVSLGPYSIDVAAADSAAKELSQAIFMAAREVDKKNTAELRARTIRALTSTGIPCESPEDALVVSPGTDLRIWVSFRPAALAGGHDLQELSARIVAALAAEDLRLAPPSEPQSQDIVERLARGESLVAEPTARTLRRARGSGQRRHR
jgi:hypothetical protein